MTSNSQVIVERLSASHSEDGIDVRIGYFGREPSLLFGSLAMPKDDPRGGVVICPPVHADAAKSYRREVILARVLARQGYAVLRFHYRGQGHSDGMPEDTTFETLKEDATTALACLRSHIGTAELALIGCRLGALVASSVAASHSATPLVLWDPVFEPARYIREATRAQSIAGLASSDTESPDSRSSTLTPGGWIDVHGYPIYERLVTSFHNRTLRDQLGTEPRSILLVQGARQPSISRSAEIWRELGFMVDEIATRDGIAWWFTGANPDRESLQEETSDIASAVGRWLGQQTTLLDMSR
jgi:pimeloyl-ACP methyl ester carboxylesterase